MKLDDDEQRVSETNIIECVRARLSEAHGSQVNSSQPFVTVTYAQSVDGSIAHAQGQTLQLSNADSFKLTHQVRAAHDGIMVGINTVMRDNPRLTVRLADGENPQPIVVDGRLRIPFDANLLKGPNLRPIVCTSRSACESKEQRLLDVGARVVRIDNRPDGLLDMRQLLQCLKRLGIRSVMAEGGATIITSLLTGSLADQYLVTISPRLIGGLRSIQSQPGTEGIARLHNLNYQWLAGDLILRGDLDRETISNDSKSVSTPSNAADRTGAAGESTHGVSGMGGAKLQ
ncbi:MAG: RibD family protein [Planctomycetales bacterium]|nr:RibD family protein [Planctomycetales bacterium]